MYYNETRFSGDWDRVFLRLHHPLTLLQRDPIFRGLRLLLPDFVFVVLMYYNETRFSGDWDYQLVIYPFVDFITTRPDFQGIETPSPLPPLRVCCITTRPDFQGIETKITQKFSVAHANYNETRFSGDWDLGVNVFYYDNIDYNETRFSGDWDILSPFISYSGWLQRDPIFRGLRR